MGDNFGQRWQEIHRRVQCEKCSVRDEVFRHISCCGCSRFFHKRCVNPLRVEWPEGEQFLCDDCAQQCPVCGDDNDEDEENPMIVCDTCDDCYHFDCLGDGERPPAEEIGDEEAEWNCPGCEEEYASDNEWAVESIVPDGEMGRDDMFYRSQCACDFCKEVHTAVDTWSDWKPNNPIQESLKSAIDAKEGLVNEVMDDIAFKHGLSGNGC